MDYNRQASSSISDGVNSILYKISDFFHIFDFPFFVSGAVIFFGGYLFCATLFNLSEFPIPIPNWFGVLFFLIASYVLGLVSFTIGRRINLFRINKLHKWLANALKFHQLENLDIVKKYRPLENNGKEEQDDVKDEKKPEKITKQKNWHLYTRMWQDMLYYRSDTLALKHLSRYWALAALYDSLAVAFLFCAFFSFAPVLFDISISTSIEAWLVPLATLFVFFSVFSFYQAAKYYAYQIEDLIASTAVANDAIIKA